MIYIAHRGNINGPNKKDENKPFYLRNAIEKGYYIETDLWVLNNNLYLGHDEPQYKINKDFLIEVKNKLFCHCKNIDALKYMLTNLPDIECFFHDTDECVLTSKSHIWTFPGKKTTNISINVMPERVNDIPKNCYGVCTDYPEKYKILIEK